MPGGAICAKGSEGMRPHNPPCIVTNRHTRLPESARRSNCMRAFVPPPAFPHVRAKRRRSSRRRGRSHSPPDQNPHRCPSFVESARTRSLSLRVFRAPPTTVAGRGAAGAGGRGRVKWRTTSRAAAALRRSGAAAAPALPAIASNTMAPELQTDVVSGVALCAMVRTSRAWERSGARVSVRVGEGDGRARGGFRCRMRHAEIARRQLAWSLRRCLCRAGPTWRS